MNFYDILYSNIEIISKNCHLGDYYTALGLPKGLCFGMAAMWGQAYLADDLKTFYKRLELLTSVTINKQFNGITYTRLTDLINAVHNYERQLPKRKLAGQVITNHIVQEREIYELVISIRAFLDGLLAYHEAKYTLVNGEGINFGQNILKTSPFVINKELTVVSQGIFGDQESNVTYQKVSPLMEIYNYPFIGNKLDYYDFLKLLVDKFAKYPFRAYIKVSSINHMVAFNIKSDLLGGYKLKLYNANNLQKNKVEAVTFTDVYGLVNNGIFEAFGFNVEQNSLLALNLSIYISPTIGVDKIDAYENACRIKFQKKIEKIKLEIYNQLNRYVSSYFKWKNHKKRAIYTRDKVRTMDINKLYNFIADEKHILRREENLNEPTEIHFNNNMPSLENNLEKSAYMRIIEVSLKKIEATYADNIYNDRGYKEMLFKKICSKGYHCNTDFLYIACRNGHTEIVSKLLKHGGIDVNKYTKKGVTPLYIACQKGHTEIVIELLRHPEIEVNKGTNTDTPLSIARHNGHQKISRAIVRAGGKGKPLQA
ncbi:ankyrin repeat protein [Allofrancisella inopinata]|uniref:Ankyrin repeat domain-containing protein n=1 Tax=Allofrancisella inopinata TaxID=1085647 RepID=A0AAE6YJN2_9GAMM|nr:ankyrin repeat domain-containing protein [Allofrancisella inopinata]QIV95959.1 ankyrin repeat domain-containing protein [Allofrancisella inopinata]TDT74381.1 ankyrin repeat protein [Allofrancisella inopinata]